jgi:hypothetical protein
MSKLKNILLFVLFFFSLLSCNTGQKGEHPADQAKPVYRVPYDTLRDDLAGFFSGTVHGKSACLAGLDTASKWKQFSFSMDSGFLDLDSSRFSKMKKWADTEIKGRKNATTLFYPFGGPDILNANIFYPKAETYIMFGLEPVGILPDLCSMNTEAVNKYLDDVWLSLKDIFKRSYFITGNMIEALKKNSVNGAVPVISLFLKRAGYHIVSLNYVATDPSGNLVPSDSLKGAKNVTKGVRIEFAGDTGRTVQSVLYFQTDISDEGMKNNPSFRNYLNKLPTCNTYLKAASYLMHGNDFSVIRNLVFEKSMSVLQDDSGIAFRLFDNNVWDIKLFGKYQRPGKEFSWINETDLDAAYRDSSIKPVPFTLGYNWRTRAINMLYAVKKQ